MYDMAQKAVHDSAIASAGLAEGCSAVASPATIASTAAAFTLTLAAGATAISSNLPSDSAPCSARKQHYLLLEIGT